MKNIYWCLLIIIIFFGCEKFPISPSPKSKVFIKLFGNPNLHNYGEDLIQTADSGFAFIGRTDTIDNTIDNNKIYVIKTNSEGNEKWSIILPNGEQNNVVFQSYGVGIQTIGANELVVLGRVKKDELSLNKLYLAKLDDKGSIKTDTTVEGEASSSYYPIKLKNTPNGELVVLADDNADLNRCRGNNFYIFKFNNLLEEMLYVKIDPSTLFNISKQQCNCVADIIPLSNGGFLVFGTFAETPIAIELDNGGNYVKHYALTRKGLANGITQGVNGSFALLYTDTKDKKFKVLQVADNLVDSLSEQTFPNGRFSEGEGKNIKSLQASAQNNEFILAGNVEKTEEGTGKKEYYVAKITNDTTVWDHPLGTLLDGNDVGTIIPTIDGGYAFVATNNFHNNRMIVLVKINSKGTLDETIK